MKKYITRGIHEKLPYLIQLKLWNMVEERETHSRKDYFHIFNLKQQKNAFIITHQQEQPKYTNTITLPPLIESIQISKVYVIQEYDTDLSYSIMLLPDEY